MQRPLGRRSIAAEHCTNGGTVPRSSSDGEGFPDSASQEPIVGQSDVAPVRAGNAARRLSWLLPAAALNLAAAVLLVAAVPPGPAALDDLARGDAPQHGGVSLSPGTCEQGP